MVKGFVMLAMMLASVAYADDTVTQLDDLERQRVILQKQVEISKLQAELNAAAPPAPAASATPAAVVATEDLATSSLQLIKVVGMASKPKAVFLYNGYRLSAERGEMVLPNIQIRNVNETYVLLKDTTTGKESVLWLSANNNNG